MKLRRIGAHDPSSIASAKEDCRGEIACKQAPALCIETALANGRIQAERFPPATGMMAMTKVRFHCVKYLLDRCL
jgi:hypothetical protein